MLLISAFPHRFQSIQMPAHEPTDPPANADDVTQTDASHTTTRRTKKKTSKKKATKAKPGRKKQAKNKAKTAKTTKKKRTKKSSSGGSVKRPYPQRSLEEALTVPEAIRIQNNGNPWDTEQVAKAVGLSKASNKFFYLAGAARDYGLTIGSRDTETIDLAALGKSIFFADSDDTKEQAKRDAFFNVDIFKKVFSHYGGGNLPKLEFVKNTLQKEFQLPEEFHDEFIKLFKANCKFLGIEEGVKDEKQKRRVEEESADTTTDVRVVGEPKGKFDRSAFVIMPFSEKGQEPRPEGFFDEVLNSLITPAANEAGFAVETANKDGSDIIQSTIVIQLLAADLVIADLTDHNPNVFIELGIRLANEKPVALVKAEGTDPVFDVDNMLRVFSYSPNLWATTVETDLPKLTNHIKASWDNAATARTYMQILTGKG